MSKQDQSVEQTSIEEQVNLSLNESIDNLSPEIRRKLNQARMTALENKRYTPFFWKSASAFSFLIAVTLVWQLVPQNIESETNLFAEVLQEDLEMLDDLEFVYWMAEADDSAIL